MPKIVLVNPPENGPFTEDVIGNLLQKQPVTACHGSEFTGRPVTKLIVDAKSVVKLRTEYSLGELQASRFAEKAIEKERNLNVHHPHKTWFLYFEPNDKEQSSDVVIGNITPKLQPLHSDSAQQTLGGESLLKLLSHLLEMYLNAARYDDARLDLCLSNFGVDDSGALFYLDDDFYTWDEFGFLPHFIGTLIRSQDWLTSDYMERLGLYLRDGILDRFQDPHWLTVIAEELRNVFVPEQRQSLRIALVNALNGGSTFSYSDDHTDHVFALMADVHANAPALETALNYLHSRNISSAIVLGDVVGYGPHPQLCVEMLQGEQNIKIIRGNHDHAVARSFTATGMTSLAGWTLNWTIEQLSDDTKQWLAELPPYLRHEDWLAVHGSPIDKTFFNAYVYQMSYVSNLENLQARNIRLCFHGHTHIQKIYYRYKGVDEMTESDTKVIQKAQHSLICPGSIGQPRNGVAGVELAIIDTANAELEFHRIDYDMKTTIDDMNRFHFPSALRERLEQGK